MGTAHKRKAERHAIENRELSWLAFNRRVQEEADNPDNPLLERAKFLAIVTSNLDEFVQVRYQRIYQAAQEGKKFGGVGGHALYRRVNRELLHQNNAQYLLYEGIRSELYLQGVKLYPTFSLDEDHIRREKALFEKEIRPFLKVEPLRGSRPRQKQLYLLVKLTRSRHKGGPFCLVGLPTALPRLFDLSKAKEEQCLIRVEDVSSITCTACFPRIRWSMWRCSASFATRTSPFRSARARISCPLCARCSPAAWGAR